MNYTQFKSDSGKYGTFYNEALIDKLPVFGDYTMIRSGEYEYILVTGDTSDGYNYTDATVYKVNRNDINGTYVMSTNSYDNVTLTISNDYYCYGTNVGRLYGGYDRYYIPVLTAVLVIGFVGIYLFHIIHDIRECVKRGFR